MTRKTKIVIVDDHELFREGLKFYLTQIADMEVIGEASNGKDFLLLLGKLNPDIVFMDIAMPEMNGIEATESALRLYPEMKIVALTGYSDEIYYNRMIQAGAVGFVTKDTVKEEIERAINSILEGKCYFTSELLQKLILKKVSNDVSDTLSSNVKLTLREQEVLYLICQGYSDNQIADKLGLSAKTVNNHRTSLLKKTGTKNTANMVMFAIKSKLVKA